MSSTARAVPERCGGLVWRRPGPCESRAREYYEPDESYQSDESDDSDESDNLDGRYFGPLPRSAIVARAVPVWTDEADDGRFTWCATRQ